MCVYVPFLVFLRWFSLQVWTSGLLAPACREELKLSHVYGKHLLTVFVDDLVTLGALNPSFTEFKYQVSIAIKVKNKSPCQAPTSL